MKQAIKKRNSAVNRKSGSPVKKAILPTFCLAVLSTIAFEQSVHAEQTNPTQINNQVVTKYVNITSGSLNLRQSASTNSAVVTLLSKGTAVTVYSETNGWAKVEVNGQEGYVSSIYLSAANPNLSPSPANETYTTKYVNVNSGSLNLRAGASKESAIVAKLSKGGAIQVYSEANGWAKVNANGKDGYVNSSFLSASNPNENSNISTNTSTNTSTNQGSQAEPATKYVNVSGGSLNLRTGATKEAAIVAKLSKGTAVQVYSEAGGWAKVSVNGKDGYVNTSFLSASNSVGSLDQSGTSTSTSTNQSSQTSTSTKYVNISSGSLNMRNGASTNASIIVKLSKGTAVKVYTESGGWSKIEVYGQTGYVSTEFLSNTVSGVTNDIPAVQQTVTKYVKVDSGSTLNLRKSITTNSTILTKLENGTEVKVYSETDGWAKVQGNGQEGYVRAEFLTETQPTANGGPAPTILTKYVNIDLGSSLNMRKSNSSDSSILLKIARGVEVTIYSEADGWSKINAYGQVGYVNSQYLSTDKPSAGLDSSADSSSDTNSSATIEKYVNVIYGSSLNMRSEASPNSSIVSKLARGSIVTVYSELNGWSKISANGQTGFVSTQYLSADEPLTPSTSGSDSETEYENYNISLDNMINIQMAVQPQTDKKYDTYIREDALTITGSDSGIVNGGWNIRGGAGTNFWVVGQVKNQDNLKIISKVKGSDGYEWYQVVYDKTWVNASPEDVAYNLNPNNFLNNTVDSLQFLNLSVTANLDASEVNTRILAGKGILQGLASAFIQAGNTYGVNEIYLISHALLETGNGTSQLANGVQFNGRTVYNMYGIGAIDASPVASGAQFAYNAGWFTPEAAIIGGAQFISKGYISTGQNTLYKMRWNPASAVSNGYASHQYASDIGWAAKQVNQINNLYSLLNSYKLVMEIPQYLKIL